MFSAKPKVWIVLWCLVDNSLRMGGKGSTGSYYGVRTGKWSRANELSSEVNVLLIYRRTSFTVHVYRHKYTIRSKDETCVSYIQYLKDTFLWRYFHKKLFHLYRNLIKGLYDCRIHWYINPRKLERIPIWNIHVIKICNVWDGFVKAKVFSN